MPTLAGHGAPNDATMATPVNGFLPITSGTKTLTITPAGIRPSVTPTRTLKLTFSPSLGGTMTAAHASSSDDVCGHALEVPFGGDVRFVLHRVRSGENLNMYAEQHRTTTNTIVAVNYRLPVPVWENWILVIPVDTVAVSDLPPFETYQALGTTLSLSELAQKLGTDAVSLEKYNAFNTSCTSFSGWILVPREADPH